MSDRVCVCGHSAQNHGVRCGTRIGPFLDVTDYPGACACSGFVDRELPRLGERLVFGVHRAPEKDAETAPAWPSLARFGAAMRKRSLGR